MKTREELLWALERAGLESVVEETAAGWTLSVPALGARILGAGTGKENALWVAPSFRRGTWEEGGNAGGERSWIAPEAGPRGYFASLDGKTWNVQPSLDPGDYKSHNGTDGWRLWRNDFTLKSADGEQIRLALSRGSRISDGPTPPDGAKILRIGLLRKLENRGDEPLPHLAGLWNIIQVPSGDGCVVLIPVKTRSKPAAVHPYYYKLPAEAISCTPGLVTLRMSGGRAYKIGVGPDASTGAIAALRWSRIEADRFCLVILRFEVDPEARYLDRSSWEGEEGSTNGDPVQAYNSPALGENAFAEIEAHAPAAFLSPGECQSIKMEITIAESSGNSMQALIKSELGVDCFPGELLKRK